MMNSIGWNSGFVLLWGIHILSVIAFFTGVAFLLLLANRKFTDAQLKQWGIWLVIVGTIVCLLTIGMTGRPWIDGASGGFGPGMMQWYTR